MTPDEAAWLARTTEVALEPELEITDPHHHLWEFPTDTYLVDQLHADTGAGHNVTRTVFVECTSGYFEDGPEALRPVGETHFVAAQAAHAAAAGGARIAGIVSFADLTLGADVEAVLAAHEAAGAGLFRGIRHASAWDASRDINRAHTRPAADLLETEAFRAGFATLGRMGYSFDAWLYHPQIDQLTALCRAHPGVTVICDHLGGPLGIGPYAGQRDEVLAGWRTSIAALASCPNVVMKVGGIGMPLHGHRWHKNESPPSSEALAAAWRDDLRFCIDQFGPHRSMFESNFPVDRKSCSYVVLWNAFKRIAAGYSSTEKADLFAGTANRVYRLS